MCLVGFGVSGGVWYMWWGLICLDIQWCNLRLRLPCSKSCVIDGQSKDSVPTLSIHCPYTVHALSMHCRYSVHACTVHIDCPCTVHGLPIRCPCTVHIPYALSMHCPYTVHALSRYSVHACTVHMGCPRTVHGLPIRCPCTVHICTVHVLLDCLWTVAKLPLIERSEYWYELFAAHSLLWFLQWIKSDQIWQGKSPACRGSHFVKKSSVWTQAKVSVLSTSCQYNVLTMHQRVWQLGKTPVAWMYVCTYIEHNPSSWLGKF